MNVIRSKSSDAGKGLGYPRSNLDERVTAGRTSDRADYGQWRKSSATAVDPDDNDQSVPSGRCDCWENEIAHVHKRLADDWRNKYRSSMPRVADDPE
jgi:hypothetical protein